VKILTSKGNLYSTMLIPLTVQQNIYSSAIISESSYIYFNPLSNLSDAHFEVWNGLENMTIETIVISGMINETVLINYTINENVSLTMWEGTENETIIEFPVELNITEVRTVALFQSDRIEINNSTILSNRISAIEWNNEISQVIKQNSESMVFIELIDSSGQIVTACYLKIIPLTDEE
jgi:hypothetical protein